MMTFKNKMTIYSFTIRHSFPNLLYVTYLHDVLYVCATSSCFCSPKGTIMKIRSILTCIMLSLPLYLNCKTFRCVYCFCKVVFYTLLLYLFFVVANKYLLTYLIKPLSKILPLSFTCSQLPYWLFGLLAYWSIIWANVQHVSASCFTQSDTFQQFSDFFSK